MLLSIHRHYPAARLGQVAPLRSGITVLVVIGLFLVGGASVANAQYYFGGHGFGYGPHVSITIPAPGAMPMPGGYVGPGYPSPFAMMADHMARRHAQMAERYAARFGYQPAPAYVPVVPVPALPGVVRVDPYPPQDEIAPLGDAAYPEPDYHMEFAPDAGSFARAAVRLTNALSQMENGSVWIEYLHADQLAELANRGQLPSEVEMRNLAARYQGVVANPDLDWVRRADGFEEVLAGLTAITGSGMEPETDVYRQPMGGASSPSPRSGSPTVAPEVESAQGNASDDANQPEGESVLTNKDTEGSVEILPAPATTSL
ncbi:hypothetical protein [Aporhodopirellula aestuarii]|uniref:Uncharacterized protein n=1 Tax=Aporhodopirellula aestuarii TaxID=2950107 RepID=A0ABT0U4Y2_9BACT|nr:hypothetical protein [Aporhodopirellula aestuarii]MCM2371411.1 hypothetical protein [Aporhodopirellula aestuarii]